MIRAQKDHHILNSKNATKTILQHLILPRILMSPVDAVYCSQFLLLLHTLQISNFNTLEIIERILRTIIPLVFSTTESEAAFIGYGLNDLLKTINKWHNSKKDFEAEAYLKCEVDISHDDFVKNKGKVNHFHTILIK